MSIKMLIIINHLPARCEIFTHQLLATLIEATINVLIPCSINTSKFQAVILYLVSLTVGGACRWKAIYIQMFKAYSVKASIKQCGVEGRTGPRSQSIIC